MGAGARESPALQPPLWVGGSEQRLQWDVPTASACTSPAPFRYLALQPVVGEHARVAASADGERFRARALLGAAAAAATISAGMLLSSASAPSHHRLVCLIEMSNRDNVHTCTLAVERGHHAIADLLRAHGAV